MEQVDDLDTIEECMDDVEDGKFDLDYWSLNKSYVYGIIVFS